MKDMVERAYTLLHHHNTFVFLKKTQQNQQARMVRGEQLSDKENAVYEEVCGYVGPWVSG